jgi:D-lyxose ketol-isomerase
MKVEQMMNNTMKVTAGALLVAVMGLTGVNGAPTKEEKMKPGKPAADIQFDNATFYGADGKFDVEKGKDAVMAVMKYHGYPVFPGMREKIWVSDYGTGQFTKLGLAAYLFMNNEDDKYMLMDIILLPGQMLPEHWHLDGAKNPAKREGWLVRWGLSHIVGEGEANLGKDVVIPKCHMDGEATTKHEVVAGPGTFVPLAKVYTRHWQFAGPEGAIITEVANVHTDSAVRHSDQKLNDFFLGKK